VSGFPAPGGFGHRAFLYRGMPEYVNGITAFVNDGLARRESALVAVPRPQLDVLRAALGPASTGVHLTDMAELGRNPSRIIPAVAEFLGEEDGRPARFVGEPIWPGRNPDEVAEAARHEALIELAFSDFPLSVLCPYDADGLSPLTIADVWRTHSEVIAGGVAMPSSHYSASVYDDRLWPLDPPPTDLILSDVYFDELPALRATMHLEGTAAGLGADRVDDLVLAVNEIASNSIEHGGGRGWLSVWTDSRYAIVCQVRDSGCINDPLVGRHAPGPDLEARGVWLANQLCDLVAIRSGPDGTHVRLHLNP
jgi:anti-sigma regulatory factor (Ser/Thr protein kinase)